ISNSTLPKSHANATTTTENSLSKTDNLPRELPEVPNRPIRKDSIGGGTTATTTENAAERSTGTVTTNLTRGSEKMAGQRFKNLRQMNNFAKFARREPAPDPSMMDLRAPDEWEKSEKSDAAQAASPAEVTGGDSWLFVPETEKER